MKRRSEGGTRSRAPKRLDVLKRAILRKLPTRGAGITWEELVLAVAPHLPRQLFPHLGAVRRTSRTVQVALVESGAVVRVPRTRPARLVKAKARTKPRARS